MNKDNKDIGDVSEGDNPYEQRDQEKNQFQLVDFTNQKLNNRSNSKISEERPHNDDNIRNTAKRNKEDTEMTNYP